MTSLPDVVSVINGAINLDKVEALLNQIKNTSHVNKKGDSGDSTKNGNFDLLHIETQVRDHLVGVRTKLDEMIELLSADIVCLQNPVHSPSRTFSFQLRELWKV